MSAAIRPIRMRRAGAVALVAVASLFAGCGDADPSLPDQASSALAPQVAAIRAAAAAGDRVGAQAGVDQLRAELSRLRGDGVLGQDDAGRVLDAVGEVEARLTLLPAPTTTTTTTSVAPAPPPGPPDDDRGPGKGKKKDDDDD